MSSIMSSQGVVLATAMAAVSGTIILLAFRLQKSLLPPNHLNFSSVNHPTISTLLLRSCISSSDEKLKDKKMKKKKVHFAEDVVDPIGNSEEYRKLRKEQQQQQLNNNKKNEITDFSSTSTSTTTTNNTGRKRGMPENRAALYNGILRDRVVHRVAYSC